MSFDIFGDDVLFFQRLLKTEGLYRGALDGIWGPVTDRGATRFYELSDGIRLEIGTFDGRTERNIQTMTLLTQAAARRFMLALSGSSIIARIISGTRTYDQQKKLYQQGRWGNAGEIVTRAKAGRSNHNFGIAWDIGVFNANGKYLTATEHYSKAAEIANPDEIEWGGNWASFFDPSHFQLQTGLSLSVLRNKFENGERLV